MLLTLDNFKSVLKIFKKDIENTIISLYNLNNKEPSGTDIPIVNIKGKMPTTKNNVACILEYQSSTLSFKSHIKIKLQGASSLNWPKKNYAIELYSNDSFNIPQNQSFKDWGSHNVYVLKANYIDHLHARNIVCANLWANIVRNREDFDTLPEELKLSPNMGATDGFPVKIYVNGKYEGIYTWNIPQKDWMFNMDKENINHAVLQGNINDFGDTTKKINPCNFNTLWDGSTHFTVEVGSESIELTNSFNNIINSVINSDISTLESVLDIQSAIDYFIFQDVILGVDGLSNNMSFLTYDMKKWYLSAYDLDSTFCLYPNGLISGTATDVMPIAYLNQYSDLLTLLVNNYDTEFKTRYAELRNSVLSYSSIISMFEKFLNIVDEDIRIQDTVSYSSIPSVTINTLNTLREIIKNRLNYLDTKYGVVS